MLLQSIINSFRNLYKSFSKPVNVKSYLLFSYFLVFCLFYEYYRIKNILIPFLVQDAIHFKWWGLGFIPNFNSEAYTLLINIFLLCLIVLLIFPLNRLLYIAVTIIYGYFLFVDPIYYNNHYYFIFLVLLLLSFQNVKIKSVFAIKDVKYSVAIPAYYIYSLRILVFILYFYGGLTKLTYDWLSTNTIKAVLTYSNSYSELISIIGRQPTIYLLTYVGMAFDLFIGFGLLIKKTRTVSIILCVIFHAINFSSIHIGVFPILSICCCLLFWDTQKMDTQINFPKYKIYIVYFFIVFNLLFPLRHLLIKGNVDWTGEGMNFSWRMKSVAKYSKDLDIQFINKRNQPISTTVDISEMQYGFLIHNPAYILQLKDYIVINNKLNTDSTSCFVSSNVFMNNRPYKQQYNNTLDIINYKYVIESTFLTK
jgi:hypothetical protein